LQYPLCQNYIRLKYKIFRKPFNYWLYYSYKFLYRIITGIYLYKKIKVILLKKPKLTFKSPKRLHSRSNSNIYQISLSESNNFYFKHSFLSSKLQELFRWPVLDAPPCIYTYIYIYIYINVCKCLSI